MICTPCVTKSHSLIKGIQHVVQNTEYINNMIWWYPTFVLQLMVVVCHTEAFAVCENYSPPEGFNPKDLHRLLEKVGSPSGADDLGMSNLPN